MWRRVHDDERGIALVVTLLVSMVILSLSVVIAQLAIDIGAHTARDEKTVRSARDAESGIYAYVATLPTLPPEDICTSISGESSYHEQYDVAITAYDDLGNAIACGPDVRPASVLVDSVGSAGSSGRIVSRRMQSKVLLDPIYGGLDNAIFAEYGLTLSNQLTVNEFLEDDAAVYTNGNFISSNNVTVDGPVVAQGSIAISNSGTFGGAWAGGSVLLSNSAVMHGPVISSTSSITVQNSALVEGDATAGTTISAGSSAITGTRTQNTLQSMPPRVEIPELLWDADMQEAWEDLGFTVQIFTDCALAKAYIETAPAGKNLVRILTPCALVWDNLSSVSVRGDLAIVTNGSISTTNNTTFTSVDGLHDLYFIVPYIVSGTPTCTPGSITISNLTRLEGLSTFVYTPCMLSFGNNNAGGWQGQLIGGTVNITNQMTLSYEPMTVPGMDVTGFQSKIAYIQELSTGA